MQETNPVLGHSKEFLNKNAKTFGCYEKMR